MSQVLAIVVRFFDPVTQEVRDAFFDSVTVVDGTAQGLYNSVKQLLQDQNIPLTNIIGFASDNCSTMLGKTGGFQALLKQDVPNVFVLGCVCHSFALCASHAVKNVPSYFEQFLKNISSYLSQSSKRLQEFHLIHDVVDARQHQIPKLAQTRWLSRGNLIAAFLEQWEALALYFQTEAQIPKNEKAKEINYTLQNKGTKHMLLFLNYVLTKVNLLNLEFQAEEFCLHTLFEQVYSTYKELLCCFVQETVTENEEICTINPRNEHVHVQTSEVYI